MKKKKQAKKIYLTQPQRLTIIVAAIALLLAGYILFTITKNATQTTTKKITKNIISPNTTLSLLKNSQEKTVYVHIDSGQQPISGVQLSMKYDPNNIQNVSITPGDFFDNPVILQNAIDRENGIIYYTLSMPATSGQIYGEGTIAVIHYNESHTKVTKLLFLPQTKITAKGINTSLLKEATPIELP